MQATSAHVAHNENESAEKTNELITREFVQRRNKLLLTFLDCILIGVAAYFIIYQNIGTHSLGMTDEVYEVGAAQEMHLSGNWLLPTIDGKPFFDKPPFKMWLTAIPVKLFGPSNFSFRILDVLFGFGTLLLTYSFSRVLFGSRLIGLFAVFSFLGCRIFVVEHGMRHAVQDSLLVFLSTAIILCGWKMERTLRLAQGSSKTLRYALLCGLFGGIALLTKSAGAIMPFLVFGCYLMFSGKLIWFVKQAWKPLLACAVLAVLIASTYFLTHCVSTPGACYSMFYHHVYKRVNGGVHNISGPWFYWIRLVEHRAAFVPELLAIAMCFAGFQWVKKTDHRYGLLLCWSLLPVLLYSIASTKLSWYIAPALPAMAILIAATVSQATKLAVVSWHGWWNQAQRISIRAALSSCFVLYALGISSYSYANNVEIVQARTNRIDLDLVVEDILRFSKETGRKPNILSYRAPRFTLDERNYHNIISPYIKQVDSLESLAKFSEQAPDFVFTGFHQIPEIARIWPLAQFTTLTPIRYRSEWIVVLAFKEQNEFKHFTFWKELIDFGSPELSTMFGFSGPERFHSLSVRHTTGDSSAIGIDGNAALYLLGAEIWLNIAPQIGDNSDPLELSLTLNDKMLSTFKLAPHKLKTYVVKVPKRLLRTGENTLYLKVKLKQRKIRATERPLMLNWASVRLNRSGES